jgi:poly-gamma-glutamate synthesis protein (capsule biosynthesis protein)
LIIFLILLMPGTAVGQDKPDLSAYPLLYKRGGTDLTQGPTGSILVVGDLLFARGVERTVKKYGVDAPMAGLKSWIMSADLAVANYEGTIAMDSIGERRDGPYRFKAKPYAAGAIKRAGFDLVSVANNHAQDWGPESLQNTLAWLHAAGVMTVGGWSSPEKALRPVVMNAGSVRTTWLAYNYIGAREETEWPGKTGWSRAWLKRSTLLKQVKEARKQGGLVIVYPHWGVEYVDEPRGWQKRLARQAMDAGADLVIGHHPHVIQTIEPYKNGLIAYSLGNFVFDQEKRDAGLALWITADRKGVREVRGITFRPYMRPVWHDPKTAHKFVKKYLK